MELKKQNYTAIWVFPFPEEPETGVLVRKLTDAESNRIYDKNKYIPGSKTATVAKANAVLNEVICASVEDWKGFTEGGVALDCTNENKLRMLDQVITGPDGEKTTVWLCVQEAFVAKLEADQKN